MCWSTNIYIYIMKKKNLNSEHQDRETSRVRDLWFSERNESLPQTFLIYLLILFKLSLFAPSMYQKENTRYISTHEIHALKTWCQKLLFTIHWYLIVNYNYHSNVLHNIISCEVLINIARVENHTFVSTQQVPTLSAYMKRND